MKSVIPPDYSKRIKQLRLRFDLTQVQMAEAMGVSFASVNRWENGQAKPNTLAWQKIVRAEVLGAQSLTTETVEASSLNSAIPNHSVKESQAVYRVQSDAVPELDFTTSPDVILSIVEGYRLAYGHLTNPTFATETSLIDPLPHQRIAVYEHMLSQARLRYLLADDAGAGKTIMAGLYIREMLARRLIQRVLIIPPAGLVGNWEHELGTLFSLSFKIVAGSDARQENPFRGPGSNLVIVSVDTLAGERMFARLQEPDVIPYDLVIFDEAHKLSADREPDFRLRKTDRYRLAEALAGVTTEAEPWRLYWSARHLLLLTATPHMGKDFPYYCLWRLLEPEALATFDAFNGYPPDARQRHFIRRTKEEMVRFDGTPIYPERISDSLSYELTQGTVSEQALYDATTQYIDYYYNRARILNRSAARLAMSIFQRRLASSTWAMICSFERRLERLKQLIDDIRSGKITPQQLLARQHKLDEQARDVLDETTADEETAEAGQEENEQAEIQAFGAVVATSLSELEAECDRVTGLLALARKVYAQGHESKFERLRGILSDTKYREEKIIIFSEHRDTLNFLVRQLEGMGFTGQVVQIHGGMDYQQREEAVVNFRKPIAEGGARYLVATDAAGEGINLQVCWLMVNYDIPWNPARLEQRMGRIHRYGQKHDPVIIINLVAGQTREGRVLKILLEKLERIRRELHSDKVFDVVGRLFEGLSLRAYLEQALTEEGAEQACQAIDGRLTPEQVRAIQERERRLYGDGGDVQRHLPRLQAAQEIETYRRLLPGYVRRYIERAAPLLDLGFEGDLDGIFQLKSLKAGALDPLWPVMETYQPEQRQALTFLRPDQTTLAIFIHPGEPFFDNFHAYLTSRFGCQALTGGVFVDPTASRPYLFRLAEVTLLRKADPTISSLAQEEVLETRLVGLREDENGQIQTCAVESLLLLRGSPGVPPSALSLAATAQSRLRNAEDFLVSQIAQPSAAAYRQKYLADVPAQESFLQRGYAFQAAELANARKRYREKAEAGDGRAKAELTRIKERQRVLASQQEAALTALRRLPDLVISGPFQFLAHALVVPSTSAQEIEHHREEIEKIAMGMARAFEEAAGAQVKDISTPELSRLAGLGDYPGFDLLSYRPDGDIRNIEVKGRALVGDVDISENEWSSACNHRSSYWLYVVFDCATGYPRLTRVKDPFSTVFGKTKTITISKEEILSAAVEDGSYV